MVLVKKIEQAKEYRPINILFVDDNMKNFYFQSLLIADKVFKRTINEYEKEMNSFLNKNKLNATRVRISMQLLYQIKNSPLKLSIQNFYSYPKKEFRTCGSY